MQPNSQLELLQRDGLSLLTKRGSARFVRLISPDKLRHYLQGGTKWVDQYEVALTSVTKTWRTRIDKDGMLSVSDLEVAPYASEFDRAYRAFGEEIGVTTLS